jgi:hypothetical protein
LVCSVGQKGKKYISGHPFCPASFADDPSAAENTKHIQPNFEFVENSHAAYDDEARVYLKCIKHIPEASEENPVTLWVHYNEIEHNYEKKKTKKAKTTETGIAEGVLSPAKGQVAPRKR